MRGQIYFNSHMNNQKSSSGLRGLGFGMLAAAFLAGCNLLPKPQPDPTRHFVLSGPSAEATNEAMAQGRLVVGLRTVQVAPYLDTKSMIVRRGENEILYRDYARWAEPLDTAINRMLVGRLYASGRVARVFPQPYPFDVERDVDVAVTVLRCEGRLRKDGTAVADLLCAVEIVRVGDREGGGAEVLHREAFVAPEVAWVEGDYAGLAAALGEQVARLAERIAQMMPDATPAGH